ncbi:MAG TPA: peptide chain release factor N(5)-glutamine methyltransferase [Thermohalobaculum sp.]|nr:peptide chain release factor N(5)-glutamine methyltransferase [Thermohalobaculum sp.]
MLAAAAARLREAGVDAPERDARLLLRWASGLGAAAFSARLAEPPWAGEAERFAQAVAARASRVPVSQIIGRRAFWGRDFRVTPDVLDPRPETETLIAAALNGPSPARILDLGTGSGCILLTLLAEWPRARGLGTDTSAAALAVAAGNALALGVAERAEFRLADWCGGLAGRFDLIVSNPPYIAAAEVAALEPEVRRHEPRQALTPEGDPGDGLDAYRRIAGGLPALLAPGGRVLLEIGPTQAGSVAGILESNAMAVSAVLPDLDGRDRVIFAHAV